MMEKIRPLHDRVLVQRLPQEEKTAGGIYIPDVAKEKGQTGKVLSVGMGKMIEGKVIPMAVKPDDVVFFGKYAGTEVSTDLVMLREDEILGVVEK